MNTKGITVKTSLTDEQSRAMDIVVAAKGFTQSGYLRSLIINDIVDSQDTVSAINSIFNSVKSGQKSNESA